MLRIGCTAVSRCACSTGVNKSGRESASTSIRRACASLAVKLGISDICVAGGSCLFGITDLQADTMVRGAVVLGASAALAAGIVLARCGTQWSEAGRPLAISPDADAHMHMMIDHI